MSHFFKSSKRATAMILTLIIMLIVTGCQLDVEASSNNHLSMRKVVDHAGREREIPVEINKVFTTGLMGSIFLYTLAPEKMIGWNNDIYEETLPYIRAEYASLPVLGRWTGTDMTGSIEELMKLSPDILINVGTISDEWIEISDEIENQLGIPVLMVSGEFYDISKAYEFMGDLLDQEKRAKTLADYARNTEKEIAELQNSLEGIEKKRTYLASGPDGLETASKGTINVELLELMGGEIVVETGGGRMEVSIEQVLLYDPEVIFVSGDSKTITDSVIWNSVSAVKNSQVYSIPKVPFDWMNRPPSIMRLIGAKWVGKALYPELFPVDLEVETAEFLELFFE